MRRHLKRVGLAAIAAAWTVAAAGRVLLVALLLLAVLVWALGTRGVPLTIDIAQKLMGGELTVAHAEGGLFGPIRLEGIVLDTAASRTEIDRLQLLWSPSALWHRTVQVDSLSVGRVRVQQKLHVAKPPQPLRPQLPRDLDIASATVQHFELIPVEGEPLQLDNLSARASWLKDSVRIDSLQFTEPRIGRVQLKAGATLSPRSITLQQLELAGPAHLRAKGLIGLMGQPSALDVVIENGRWPLQGAAQLRVPRADATLRGVLSGAPLGLDLALKAALRTAIADKPLGFDLDTALQLGESRATLQRLSLRSTDGAGSLTAEGSAAWRPALQVEANATLLKLDPGVLLPDWKGQLNGQLKASTRLRDGLPVVDFSAALKDSRLRGYPLQLDARGRVALQGESRQLDFDSLLLQSGSTRIAAEGQVLPVLDAHLEIDARDLKTLLPTLAGAVQLEASAQGAPSAPAVQAKGSARGLQYGAHRIASAELRLDFAPATASSARLVASGLQLGGTTLASASLLAEGLPERHQITLEASASQPRSTATLTLAGALDLAARRWQGALQQSRFTPPYGPVWQQEAPGALRLTATEQALEPTCWRAERARLCLDATLAPPRTRIAYRLEQLETAAFAALLPKDWKIETTLDGAGEVALDGAAPTRLDLDLKLGAGRIQLPGAPPLQLLPSTLVVAESGGSWRADAQLLLDRGSLQVQATLPVAGAALLDRPLAGRVQLAVPDLAWVTPLIPQVQDLRGALAGDFRMDGSAGAPRLDGALQLVDGRFGIAAAGIVVQQVTAEVRGSNSGVLNFRGSASSGGTLRFEGTADFASGQPVVQLKIVGSEVQVADVADARVWVSPDLVYAQDAEGMRLTGRIDVPKADITPRRLAANAIGASADQVLVGSEAPVARPLPLSAEVTLVLGEKVSFEGFGLKSKITGSVTAIDRPGSGGTRGRGELRLVDAAYKAYGQEIQVETGRILFNGGPIGEPTIDLVARRSPREDVTVSLHVRGTLDQPTFDLTSSPAMPREQQLGWLLFGRPIDSGAGGELSGAAAALSLGIAGGDALASRLGKVIGLDQVSLGADATSSAWQSSHSSLPGAPGTDQTRFTVGKYLSPKLFVSYGVGLFDNGNVLRLLYDLGRGFKLRTEAGLETGGDLLYSVERE